MYDEVFLQLKILLEPFGITRYYAEAPGSWRASGKAISALLKKS